MKQVITIVAALITLAPSAAMADGRHWRAPDRHESHRGGGVNPWPFIAGAVVGGLIVHASEADEPRAIVGKPNSEPPVLINGVWMQRTLRCVQEIVVDRRGDESVVNRCNYVYVPVQVEK
jgi:hypothetical protein